MGIFNPRLGAVDAVSLASSWGFGRKSASVGMSVQEAADLRGQLSAIRNTQAVVEFDTAGIVLHANANFLQIVGYALEDIRGHHHSTFVTEHVRNSAPYLRFWQELGAGKVQQGAFKRRGRDGSTIWLNASYTPIRDESGSILKIVKYATDITAQRMLSVDVQGQLSAINRSQAVVQFSPDGTIIDANSLFLETMGYNLDEITGKHHSIFMDAQETRTAAYTRFWQELGAGQSQSGNFRRLGKDGREVWINASYTPIVDDEGKVYKVVEYARDITGQITLSHDHQGQVNAIRSSQAVVQFEIDGTVFDANALFLDAMGYSLDEIKGKHHRMFVDMSYGNSDAYRHFWRELAAGHAKTDDFRRVGKNGREVWIRASYTPIKDANGKVYKVVKYASDITEQKKTVHELVRIIDAVNAGDLTQRAVCDCINADNQAMRQNINTMLDTIAAPLDEVSRVMRAVADNNLTLAITGEYQGSLKLLKGNVNLALEQLRESLLQVRENATSVKQSAAQIATGNQALNTRTEEQAANLEETAAAMEEMAATVEQNTISSKRADSLAREASDKAATGGQVVEQAIAAMLEINASSQKIAEIISVIDGIAFQTNLLALNAAVEAARAGDQGRGFAVVADEVRNLAGRSATAAKEIKQLIADSTVKVNHGSALVNKSGETLTDIMTSVRKVSEVVAEIMSATDEQNAGIDAINKTVQELDRTTQHNSAMAEEAAANSTHMGNLADGLNDLVDRFLI